MKFTADFLINLGLLTLGLFFLVLVSDYPKEARLFPQLVLITMITLILFHIAARIRTALFHKKSSSSQTAETDKSADQKTFRFFLTIGLMASFIYAIQVLGFTVGTFIFISISIWVLGYRNLKYLALSSIIITGFMYIVFVLIMDSLLPQGLLFDLLRN